MSKFYSKTTNGFYDSLIHNNMPVDAVEISDETYSSILEAQAAGANISGDESGNPIFTVTVIPAPRLAIIQQMILLENQITARRRDEAILGTDGGWLLAQRASITALRDTLPPL
jgi:hypothetical protein